jgi:DNA repair exonuclease SbcCD ATPase subunit
MSEFKTLRSNGAEKANPKLTALKVELAKVENEIEKLLETLTGANPTLLSYANRKIEALDSERQRLAKGIADLSAEEVSPESVVKIAGYLSEWDNVDFNDKRQVVDGMISLIRAKDDYLDIQWKI